VDVAAFIGYRQKKVLGAILAPIAVCLPGALLVLALATVLGMAAQVPVVQSAFVGIRVAVCALLTASVANLLLGSVKRWWQLGLAAAAFAVVAIFGQNPAWVVLGAGALGLCWSFRKGGSK
jgi:chromate transporter